MSHGDCLQVRGPQRACAWRTGGSRGASWRALSAMKPRLRDKREGVLVESPIFTFPAPLGDSTMCVVTPSLGVVTPSLGVAARSPD